MLGFFFRTQLGLCIRATGDNEDMVRSSSINTERMKFIGLGLANALVALSGGMLAQYQNFADLSMGIGMVVIGLASLIIGEVIFGKKTSFGTKGRSSTARSLRLSWRVGCPPTTSS